MAISNLVSMFYNAPAYIFERAKHMRANMTPSEQKVWEFLKGKQILGLRFRPQHPMDIFIADFYCHPLKLVIEIDGGIHRSNDRREYDLGREAELERWDIKIVRFTNEEIEKDIGLVQRNILQICSKRQLELQNSQ